MMHSESTTRSPSSFNFTRSTPCVDGCCGPMFKIISSAPSTVVSTFESPLVRVSVIFCFAPLLPAFDSQVLAHPGRVLLQNVVILAQRIAFPLVRQQDALQIRMPFENNSKHVEALALEPVRRRPHFADARHRLVLARVSLQTHPLVLRERVQNQDHVEPLLAIWPVHR